MPEETFSYERVLKDLEEALSPPKDIVGDNSKMISLKCFSNVRTNWRKTLLNVWNVSAATLTPEFKTLLHIAFFYKTARQTAQNHRAFDILSDSDELEERAARSMFVRA